MNGRQEPSKQGSFLVLASGGIDSSTLLWLSADEGLKPTALFLDYGQPAAAAEREAVERICTELGIDWRAVRYTGSSFGFGEIRGRNAFLLHTALLEFPSNSGVVALGIHAGTGYVDCSPEFLKMMQASYDLHTNGTITASAPFLNRTKQDVYRLASKLNVPVDKTHSCEASNEACGSCRSCLDRNLLVTSSFSC